MRVLMLLSIIFILGCEVSCPCQCDNCGVNCRNICTDKNCIPGERCCDKCICHKKPSIKIHD